MDYYLNFLCDICSGASSYDASSPYIQTAESALTDTLCILSSYNHKYYNTKLMPMESYN